MLRAVIKRNYIGTLYPHLIVVDINILFNHTAIFQRNKVAQTITTSNRIFVCRNTWVHIDIIR